MDDWLTNTAGAVPGDGAFERFLTAALAAIITLVFSWRLLGEVSESEREAAIRRHAAAKASGQYNASQLGISDEKLREVAEAFAKDRVEKLKANSQENTDGSCVDTDKTEQPSDNTQGAEGGPPCELSPELSSEDRQFLEDLLKSSIGASGVGEKSDAASVSSTAQGVSSGNVVPAQTLTGEVCVSQDSDNQQTARLRMSDFPLGISQGILDADIDTEREYNTTTTPVDSDEDDFQDYFDEDINPRVLDSDEETFYRTFLEPIQEELSGEDRGSSSDEWGECDETGATGDEQDSENTTPTSTEAPVIPEVNKQSQSLPGATVSVMVTGEGQSECDSTGKTFPRDAKKASGDVNGLSGSRVFDAYHTSPEHKMADSTEADDTEMTDDSISEESDDTVIMVFSNMRNGEENGNRQSQNEIVFLNQERYDGCRDMFLTEKFEEMDSDDDVIIPPSKHYDQIRNNLTLIGSDDGDNMAPDYDDYERGSWSDPDDNFRCSIPRWDRYGNFGIDDFVKNNNSSPSFYDDSFSWKSSGPKNSFKPDVDFEFGQNTPKGYDDAPFSNAAEESPVGFTFVEVKDSFTEFSLRNYVRDKEHFDPKSDSGIFTDSEEFAMANSMGKSVENETTNSADVVEQPGDTRGLQDIINGADYREANLEQASASSAISIDSPEPCTDQYSRSSPGLNPDKSFTAAEVNIDQSPLNTTNNSDNVNQAAELPSRHRSPQQITPEKNEAEIGLTEFSDTLPQQSSPVLHENLSPDPASLIDEAFSFTEGLLEPYVDSGEGSGDSRQTLPNSCQLRGLEQTEITCWSSHVESIPRDIGDLQPNLGNNDISVAESDETFPSSRIAEIKLEHKAVIRPDSPVSSAEYYTERKRSSHNEAVLLDQVIAPDNELSRETNSANAVYASQARDVRSTPPLPAVAPYGSYSKRESSVDPLPWELLSGEDISLTESPGKQTDIDCDFSLTYSNTNNPPDRLSDRSANDSEIAFDRQTTPEIGTGVVMRADIRKNQAENNSSGADSTEPEEARKNTNRDSIILEESPVICLTLDSKEEAGDENVFEDIDNSPTSPISPDSLAKQGVQLTSPQPHSPASSQVSNSTTVLETGDSITLPQGETPKSLSSAEPTAVLDPGDRVTLPRTHSESTGSQQSSPEPTANFDRGDRVTLPRRYTPSADYRKLLKPTTPRRYTSVLQRPISTDRLHVSYSLPDKPVPKIRRKILASRQRFLSEDNLCSPNDSFEDAFSDHSAAERFHPRRSVSPTSPTNRQSYSVADISRLYASTLSSPQKPRPCIDQLHENCILSPERLALLRKRAFSTDSLGPRHVSRQPSVSSLVETDIDTGETSETPQFTETDLDVPFRLQTPVEKTVSMMDLRSGRSRFAARKKAVEERKKSKSLQQLGTNIGSLETDIDAPFPDGSGVTRVPSEHELRVTKSLSKLNVPDWLRRSTVFRTGSHFILRRDSNASSISQWSSKSYGPLATTRDSSRASSCVTLSQPSPVVIRTRVQPSSPSRLIGSPSVGSNSRSHQESRQVKLPSAKFRDREKPSGLMPIPIVPFEKLRQKFEKNSVSETSPQPVKEVETTIIVEPTKNPPPGILKQTQPSAIVVNSLEQEPMTIDRNRANKSVPTLQVRLPPPKITVTSEKNVSPKDKTSPSAFEKSVRFSPVLNRMDYSTAINTLPPSPEEDYQPVNGGAGGKKPSLPPKPAKKLLQWKSAAPGSEDTPVKPEKPTPKPTPKPAAKPAGSEKQSRIANLIRRFKETTV